MGRPGRTTANLTKHYISDTELDIARELIKEQKFDDLELLLDVHPQDLLSQLVRTTFTAETVMS